jgi:hypothetical protein
MALKFVVPRFSAVTVSLQLRVGRFGSVIAGVGSGPRVTRPEMLGSRTVVTKT